MIFRSIAIAALAFSAGVQAAELTARQQPAEPANGCCEKPYRYVYAESWYGAKKVVAPVRHGPLGDEVLLPGGIWVECELSCEYILRKQTLEYWESQGAGSGSQFAPAYPRQDSYVDPWGGRQGYLF